MLAPRVLLSSLLLLGPLGHWPLVTACALYWPPTELADNTSCAVVAVDPARHMGRILLPNRYNATTGGVTVFAPIFSSLPLIGLGSSAHATGAALPPADKITHAIILVHGLAGDANSYFCDGVAATAAAGATDTTIVIAPWFGSQQVTADQWSSGAAAADSLARDARGTPISISSFWDSSRWLKGGDNSPRPERFTTSFDVIDAVVETLRAQRQNGWLPNLGQISIAGFSAGAQLVSRWAAFSPVPGVRTIAGDGSSYMYLDKRRPAAACNALANTGAAHTCATFAPPPAAAAAACPNFDFYKFGIGNLTQAAEDNMYIGQIKSADEVVQRFMAKDARFILGTQDVCNCNSPAFTNDRSLCYPRGTTCSPDATGGQVAGVSCCDTWPDTGSNNALATYCEAMLMGTNRLQRGLNYVDYLRTVAAEHHLDGKVTADPWPKYALFDGGHDNKAFYSSPAFRSWVFGG